MYSTLRLNSAKHICAHLSTVHVMYNKDKCAHMRFAELRMEKICDNS